MLANDLGFGHGLLFDERRNHLVARPHNRIIAGADGLGIGQLQALQGGICRDLHVDSSRPIDSRFSNSQPDQPARQSPLIAPDAVSSIRLVAVERGISLIHGCLEVTQDR